MVDSKSHDLDPVYVHSLREAKVILLVFAAFAVYVLISAFLFGQHDDTQAGPVATVLGIPAWVFWSIVVPWLAANVVTGWFCFGFMQQDTLEDVERISGESSNAPEADHSREGL